MFHSALVPFAERQKIIMEMQKIKDCLHCGLCKSKCPYELDTPTLLEKNYEDYKKILKGERSVAYSK